MRGNELEWLNADQIDSALDEAINQPLATLLSIDEFLEKLGRPLATEEMEPAEELQRAA